MKKTKKRTGWLLPTVLILFILEILTLPLILLISYANTPSDHILTVHKNGTCVWDSQTEMDEGGAAILTLFDKSYNSDTISDLIAVNADDGKKVVAPGTEGQNNVQLKNETGETLSYVCTLYVIEQTIDDKEFPVTAQFNGASGEATEGALPEGMEGAKVIEARKGDLPADQIANFPVEWLWKFEDENDADARDAFDTLLGNKAAAGEEVKYTIGVYFHMEGVEPPQTGENTMLYWFIALIAVSGAVLVLALIGRKRRRVSDEI